MFLRQSRLLQKALLCTKTVFYTAFCGLQIALSMVAGGTRRRRLNILKQQNNHRLKQIHFSARFV